MSKLTERLAARYSVEQQPFIYKTSKQEALHYLDRLRAVVERMEDFDRFPERNMGVIIHAIIDSEGCHCPDGGDFGHLMQGVRLIVEVAGDDVMRTQHQPWRSD